MTPGESLLFNNAIFGRPGIKEPHVPLTGQCVKEYRVVIKGATRNHGETIALEPIFALDIIDAMRAAEIAFPGFYALSATRVA